MTKQDVMNILQTLPDDVAFDELAVEIEKFRFKAKVQRAMDQMDRGEGIPEEEIDKMVDGWLAE